MKKLTSVVLSAAMVMGMAAIPAGAAEITDLDTYETTARELETWNVHYSQAAADLNVLCNLIDGLLTNDNHGNLVENAAKEYSTEDGGKTWTFVLNDGMTWVDKDGNVKADVTSEDWVYGLEWVLNYYKNDSYNTSMPIEMIEGAGDYYEYTKGLAEDEALALGTDKLLEMVGIATPDEKTIVYTCTDALPYFASVATYNCLYPLSKGLIDEIGVDGYKNVTWENMWYSGPYTITSYIYQNEKVYTKTPNYWNDANVKRFDTVTCHMVESVATAYQLFQTGELDNVSLEQSTLTSLYENSSSEFHDYLVEDRPTKYSYQMHLVYDKLLEDGSADENWNKAVANENFRLSLYYGLELTPYLARTNAINPLSCENYVYTGNGVAFTSDGTDYTQLVRDEIGLQYDRETYNRADADKAAEYKAAAIAELTEAGVTFPVEIDYYIKGDSQTAADSAAVLTQVFSDCLGDDYVKLVTKTYVSSLAQEVRNPQLASFYINGWGADFADPINFLGQETYGDDNAYYSQAYSKINNATDEALIATYQEFTNMVNEAKAITSDIDARYAAFAKAEAYMLNHALVIPMSYEVSWQLSCVNLYSKVYSMYGMQANRYVNWETDDQIYTTEQMEAFKQAYEAE